MKLSIIVPVYNVERYLPRCLDSLLSDSLADYEILLINDGSTDGSLAVCEAYRKRFPSLISVITTENRGQGHARNLGIERARGDFLYFIDSDDYLAPGGLEGIYSCLEQDYDLFLFDSVAVNVNGQELKPMPGCTCQGSLNLRDSPDLLLQDPDVWNKISRRRLWLDSGLRFPEGVWFEDLATVPKLYAFTDKVCYIPQAWHRYLQRYDSVTNTTRAMRNLEIIPAVEELRSFYRERGQFEALRGELDYLVFYCEFLTSSVRANLADWRSPAQEELMRDFLEKVPHFRDNPYFQRISRKHRLLTWLLLHRLRLSVHLLMKLNNRLKDKRT